MAKFRFVVIRDCNTFSAKLKKGMHVVVDCEANNNPFLLIEDRQKVAMQVSEKYSTYCSAYAVLLYFKVQKYSDEIHIVLTADPKSDPNITALNTMGAFIDFIENNGLPDKISISQNLNYQRTGYDCAEWLYRYCLRKSFPMDFKIEAKAENPEDYRKIIDLFSREINYND